MEENPLKITLTAPSIYEYDGLTLLPGENEVDETAARKMLSNPTVKHAVDAGILVFEEEPKSLARKERSVVRHSVKETDES